VAEAPGATSIRVADNDAMTAIGPGYGGRVRRGRICDRPSGHIPLPFRAHRPSGRPARHLRCPFVHPDGSPL